MTWARYKAIVDQVALFVAGAFAGMLLTLIAINHAGSQLCP